MQRNVTNNPPKMVRALRSRSRRLVAAVCEADFLRSENARPMPFARFLRMRNRVKQAPTSMPPTAMGLTMDFQMASFTEDQSRFWPPGRCGPRK